MQVMALAREAAETVLGAALQPLLQQRLASRSTATTRQSSRPQIEYRDLEMHRVVGTGQFGSVRVVRHIPTNQAYALKVFHQKTVWCPHLTSVVQRISRLPCTYL